MDKVHKVPASDDFDNDFFKDFFFKEISPKFSGNKGAPIDDKRTIRSAAFSTEERRRMRMERREMRRKMRIHKRGGRPFGKF